MRKAYSDIDGEYGQCGERATITFFESLGFYVSHLPDGKYGSDLFCESEHERFYCGSELRTASTWPSSRDSFPYATYNLLARRERESGESLLVVWREDMERGIVVFRKDSVHFPVVYKNNRHAKNEDMREIPIERCLPIRMGDTSRSSISSMNYKRVKDAVSNPNLSVKAKSRYLHPTAPYGVTGTEYARLLTECGRSILGCQPATMPKKSFVQNMLFDTGA